MLLLAFTLLGLIATSTARPNSLAPQNVVVVPPNCPPGQTWVNGQCRDVWRLVPAPIILPKLRFPTILQDTENPAWDFKKSTSNEEYTQQMKPMGIITIPNQCPVGYKPDALGICREIF